MLRSIALLLCLSAGAVAAQETAAVTSAPLNVFLDCQDFGCDFDYFRTELTMVNWVRDRDVSDVHLLVTSQSTGAGGREYTVTFIGLRRFAGMTDTLKYVSLPAATEDERRKGLERLFRIGFVRYLARTPAAGRLTIGLESEKKGSASQTSPTDDPWKNWVFRVSLNGWGNGEETYRSFNIGGNLGANRVTEKWKTSLSANESYNESEFELSATNTVVNIQRYYSASGLQVRSLGPHWSAGLRASMTSSTYDNYLRALRVLPALEYNVFPYSQSTRRQMLFEYNIGYAHFAYRDTTIFFKTKESMPIQRLLMTVASREQWGSIDVGTAATSYLHDLSKYRVGTFSSLSLRLFRGFNIELFGQYDIIYDQFGLALKDFTDEEKLTRQFQLGTTYRYWGQVRLSYTFGSIYNNVVNPRMSGGFFD